MKAARKQATQALGTKEARDPVLLALNAGQVHKVLPGASGSYCSDWWYYLRNAHLELGTCCADPRHPTSKAARAAVVFVGWSTALFLAVLWERLFSPAGALRESVDAGTRAELKRWLSLILGGFIITVWGFVCSVLASCSCVQGSNVYSGVRKGFTLVGYAGLCVCVCQGIICVSVAIAFYTGLVANQKALESDLADWLRKNETATAGVNGTGLVGAPPEQYDVNRTFWTWLESELFATLCVQPGLLFAWFNLKRRWELQKLAKETNGAVCLDNVAIATHGQL